MKLEADGGFGVGGTHTHTIDNGQVMNGDINAVMENQKDLVEIVTELKQILTVKG